MTTKKPTKRKPKAKPVEAPPPAPALQPRLVMSDEKMEELRVQVENMKRDAYGAARALAGGMVGPASSVVQAARITVIEQTLAVLAAHTGQYKESMSMPEATLSELRDYWEAVKEEIANGT